MQLQRDRASKSASVLSLNSRNINPTRPASGRGVGGEELRHFFNATRKDRFDLCSNCLVIAEELLAVDAHDVETLTMQESISSLVTLLSRFGHVALSVNCNNQLDFGRCKRESLSCGTTDLGRFCHGA